VQSIWAFSYSKTTALDRFKSDSRFQAVDLWFEHEKRQQAAEKVKIFRMPTKRVSSFTAFARHIRFIPQRAISGYPFELYPDFAHIGYRAANVPIPPRIWAKSMCDDDISGSTSKGICQNMSSRHMWILPVIYLEFP